MELHSYIWRNGPLKTHFAYRMVGMVSAWLGSLSHSTVALFSISLSLTISWLRPYISGRYHFAIVQIITIGLCVRAKEWASKRTFRLKDSPSELNVMSVCECSLRFVYGKIQSIFRCQSFIPAYYVMHCIVSCNGHYGNCLRAYATRKSKRNRNPTSQQHQQPEWILHLWI